MQYAGHIVVVQVLLTSTTEHDLRRFNEAVRRIPEIESCHMIAGDFDYLLKVRTRDINEYRRVMGEAISGLPCVKGDPHLRGDGGGQGRAQPAGASARVRRPRGRRRAAPR